MDPLLFQIIIAANAFLLGAVLVLAVQHARAHFRGEKPELTAQKGAVAPQLRQQLLAQAQERYNTVVAKSAETLASNLNQTTAELTQTLTEVGTNILEQETKAFGEKLTSLRQTSESMIDGANGTIAQQKAQVEAEIAQYKMQLEQDMAARLNQKEQMMAAELTAQKQQLIAALDSKLTDTISAFLAETLGNEVDLGAQAPYLVAMLEERKAELIDGVNREA
jgi:hypothetical protein